jgi:hypothetical protein
MPDTRAPDRSSRGPTLRPTVARLRCRRCFAHVEFENAANHDKFLRVVAVLGAHEAERLLAIDEKSATDTARVLHDPVPMTVAPNPKPRRLTWSLAWHLAWRLRVWRLRVWRLRVWRLRVWRRRA